MRPVHRINRNFSGLGKILVTEARRALEICGVPLRKRAKHSLQALYCESHMLPPDEKQGNSNLHSGFSAVQGRIGPISVHPLGPFQEILVKS